MVEMNLHNKYQVYSHNLDHLLILSLHLSNKIKDFLGS